MRVVVAVVIAGVGLGLCAWELFLRREQVLAEQARRAEQDRMAGKVLAEMPEPAPPMVNAALYPPGSKFVVRFTKGVAGKRVVSEKLFESPLPPPTPPPPTPPPPVIIDPVSGEVDFVSEEEIRAFERGASSDSVQVTPRGEEEIEFEGLRRRCRVTDRSIQSGGCVRMEVARTTEWRCDDVAAHGGLLRLRTFRPQERGHKPDGWLREEELESTTGRLVVDGKEVPCFVVRSRIRGTPARPEEVTGKAWYPSSGQPICLRYEERWIRDGMERETIAEIVRMELR